MKNKDAIIVILLVLILVIAVAAVIYISILKTSQNNLGTSNIQNNATTNDPTTSNIQNNATTNNPTTEKVPTNNSEVENDKPQTSDKTETNTKLDQVYEKYSNLKWERGTTATDGIRVTARIDTNSGTVKLKDTYSTAGKEQTVSGISNAKYVVISSSCRGFHRLAVLTKDGKIYVAYSNREDKINFKEINLSEKIVDMTLLADKRLTSCSYQEIYFLTETGRLVNIDEETYESRNDEYKTFLGNIDLSIYVYKDNTIGYILSDKCDDMGCKENRGRFEYKGKEVVAKKIFIVQRTLNDQELETIGRSPVYTAYVYTDNGELLYINDYEMNKLTLKLHATGIEKVEQTSTNKVKVTYTNGKNETFNDANIEF